jgi:hypothetical protein
MDEVFNERLKLSASGLNQLATAVIVTGVLAPLAAVITGFQQMQLSGNQMILFSLYSFCIGLALHFFARDTLNQLRI